MMTIPRFEHLAEHLAQLAGISLVSGIWQGFLLALALWLCLRLIPRTPAAVRYALWSAVLLLIAVLPLFEPHLPHSAAAVARPLLHVDPRWSLALAATWAIVSLFRAASLAVHAVQLWRIRRSAAPVAVGPECAALLASAPRRVTLCTSMLVDRPSVAGFFRPRILIPGWLFEQLTPDELTQVVLHELEHLRRGDDWLNLLQKLSLVLFPLNPILSWVERRLCYERELACDDGVLRRTRAPRAYATCLTSLAERGLDRRSLALALGVAGAEIRQSELSRRIHRILRRETPLTPWKARALTAAVVLGLAGGSVELARCPQIVSFAAPALTARATTVPDTAAILGDRITDPTARAIPVSYNESAKPARMILTSAVIPTKKATPAKAAHKAHIAHPVQATEATQRLAKSTPPVRKIDIDASAAPKPASGWVVLTSMPMMERTPQMILPVVDGNNHLLPYAAVPTADGWLLVQL